MLLATTALAYATSTYAQTLEEDVVDTTTAYDMAPTSQQDPAASGLNRENGLSPTELQDLNTASTLPVGARLNPAQQPVTGQRSAQREDETGVTVGSFILRPSITQSVGYEKTTSNGSSATRTYSQTDIEASLTSDWSRHQLKIDGKGTYQKNFSGSSSTEPSASLDAELRLDIGSSSAVTVHGSYDFYRVSTTDPNSVSGATTQSAVNEFGGGIKGETELGRLRGSADLSFSRSIYGAATLSDNSTLSMSDRNETTAELTLRAGYEVSSAFTPFVEGSFGRGNYDQSTDSSGYARNSASWGIRAGSEMNFGEKLTGEASIGYLATSYSDSRLASISALTLDGDINWSPRRGTSIATSLSTSIEPSTTAGTSGSTVYNLSSVLSHELSARIAARVSGGISVVRYPSASTLSNYRTYEAGAGLTFAASPYVDLNADVSWEKTDYTGTSDDQTWTFMTGLKLKR